MILEIDPRVDDRREYDRSVRDWWDSGCLEGLERVSRYRGVWKFRIAPGSEALADSIMHETYSMLGYGGFRVRQDGGRWTR